MGIHIKRSQGSPEAGDCKAGDKYKLCKALARMRAAPKLVTSKGLPDGMLMEADLINESGPVSRSRSHNESR